MTAVVNKTKFAIIYRLEGEKTKVDFFDQTRMYY